MTDTLTTRRTSAGIAIAMGALALIAPTVGAATGAWSSSGPEGGLVFDLAVDPNEHKEIWAVAAIGLVYRSTDKGETWAFRGSGIASDTNVEVVAVSPSDDTVVYAGGWSNDVEPRLFRTDDDGASWTARDTGIDGLQVRSIAVSATDPDLVYVGTTTGGVYKTLNGGIDWDPASDGLESGAVEALTVRPGNPDNVFAGTSDGVYRTQDGGDTWTPRTTGLDHSVSSIAIDPFDDDRLYAGTFGGEVFETFDNGANWAPLGTGLPNDVVAEVEVHPTEPLLFAVDNQNGIYTLDTSAGSPTWTAANDGLDDPAMVVTFAIDPVKPLKRYVGLNGTGIARQTDGLEWSPASIGLTASSVEVVAVDPDQPLTAYAVARQQDLLRTTDGGGSWEPYENDLPDTFMSSLAISPSDPDVMYAGTSDGVSRSTDGGASWTPTDTTETAFEMVIHPTDPDTVWIATQVDGVLRTSDGGDEWSPVNSGLPTAPLPFFTSLAISPSDPDVLYAGEFQQAFKTTDGGGQWTDASTGLEATDAIEDLAVHPTDPDKVYAAIEETGAYRTKNGGDTWVARGLDGKDLVAIAIDPAAPKTLYAGTFAKGMRRTLDAGVTWSTFNTGLTAKVVFDIAISPDGTRIYIGTIGGGVFSYTVP